jgi:hypothetical protein
MKNLQTQNQAIKAFEQTCNDIIQAFIRKQGLTDEFYWLEDKPDPAGIVCFGTDVAFLSFSDIFYDLKHKRKKGLILEWYNKSIESHEREEEGIIPCYDEFCQIQDFMNGKLRERKSFSFTNMGEIREHLMK